MGRPKEGNYNLRWNLTEFYAQCPKCLFSTISYATNKCPHCGWATRKNTQEKAYYAEKREAYLALHPEPQELYWEDKLIDGHYPGD